MRAMRLGLLPDLHSQQINENKKESLGIILFMSSEFEKYYKIRFTINNSFNVTILKGACCSDELLVGINLS